MTRRAPTPLFTVGAACISLLLDPSTVSAAAAAQPSPAAKPAPAQSRPNVLVWMIDDLGFGQLGAFGGLIETPNLDWLASQGLSYTNYHTTPVCSSSRAAFLTGRNSHSIHMGNHVATALPFPGYDGEIPAGAGTVAENLRQAGYRTYAVGKWDHMRLEEMTAGGPYTYWPGNQGFDRYYGFLAADTDNFRPQLWSDHAPVTLPRDPSYHLTADLADHAIDFIQARTAVAERPPFFLYYATGAVHAPHHAPASYLQHYRGRFDMGWDKARAEVLRRQIARGVVPKGTRLPPRPDGMPAWDSLTSDQKRMYARAMEAFAAQLTHADAEFGRILDALRRNGELDNTMIIVTSDNGASAEGAPDGTFNEALFSAGRYPSAEENLKFYDAWGSHVTFNHYPMGWAVAGNTPFRYYKITAYEGGIHVPLIVAWPKGIAARGERRGQYAFVADLTPTILEATRTKPAEVVNGVPQTPFEGVSLAYTFGDAKAADRKHVQYYEMFGNRAIWADGWKAVVPHAMQTWRMGKANPFSDDRWELYDLRKDINEIDDVAAKHPEKLREMQALFDQQAKLYNVTPLHDISEGGAEIVKRGQRQFAIRGGIWSYPAPVSRLQWSVAPPVLHRSFTMTAAAKLTAADATGPIWVLGGEHGGMAFYLDRGRPVFAYRDLDLSLHRVAAQDPIAAGERRLTLRVDRDKDGATVSIAADGRQLASGRIDHPFSPTTPLNDSFGVGTDVGSGVAPDYVTPIRFPGELSDIRFDFNAPPEP